jgi:hypothetical protein
MVPGEEPSPVSASLSLAALNEHLVVGFLGDIFPLQLVKPGFYNQWVNTVSRCSLCSFGCFGIQLVCKMNWFKNSSIDLNMDELTVSHRPFNSGYVCNFIKSTAISSKMFKIKFIAG